ncbi:restriction endonuclease subunit S, partial [Nitrosomonas sp.]|uniref:restriction endonuclease subunit S n=1 Tax=Nitrosomonas sp. TaxID=42353 RepID=UPI001DF1CCF9
REHGGAWEYQGVAEMKNGWQTKTLDQISTNLDSRRVPITRGVRSVGKYPYYGASGIVDYVADYIFDENALLISEDGANLLARSTPIAFPVSGKYWVNNHAHILKFENPATQRFVELYLESIPLDDYITGAAQPKLNQTALNSIPIPFPPLPEQQRIVGILDEAFDGLARATANAEQNLRNARALFESHLQSVFTQLRGSPVVPIGDVAEVFDGPHATPKTVDAGPVFLGISALQDGRINLEATRHVTPQDFKQWTRRVKPQADDVVFSYETRLGQAALIPNRLECCLGRRMGLVRVNRKQLDPRFFVYQYISPPFRKFLDSKTVRGATVDRIALKDFPSFPISLPSLPEQERMTSRLDKLRAETQRLESIYQQKLAALGELKKSLLHQAFSGNL